MKGSDRTTIMVALIGGIFVLLAALIGLFNPIAEKLADRLLSEPTATALPTTPPSLTPQPQPTDAPTATATPPPPTASPTLAAPSATPRATRLPTFAAPRDNSVQFILANNAVEPYSFYIDGAFVTDIGSGQVLVFDAPRDTHQLETCPTNLNPIANADDCDSVRYDLNEDPFDWTIGGDAKPTGNVTLVLMNISTTPVDIYLDGAFARTLQSNQYALTTAPPGKHTLQNCPTGVTPDETDTTCVNPTDQTLSAPVEWWKIGD